MPDPIPPALTPDLHGQESFFGVRELTPRELEVAAALPPRTCSCGRRKEVIVVYGAHTWNCPSCSTWMQEWMDDATAALLRAAAPPYEWGGPDRRWRRIDPAPTPEVAP